MQKRNKYIVFFEDCGRGDINLVGGKCANLGEMYKIGIPVPLGFAITTKVYNRFLELTNIGNKMQKYMKKLSADPTTIDEFNKVGDDLASFILESELPKELLDPISEAYDSFCERIGIKNLSVAVRSSGVAEDSATASFAGQYESYLNVIGKKSVFESIMKCWASAFTPRCISYRIHHGLGVLAGSISVAVQKMVNPRAAGVGFTVSPTTGDENRIVIEGNWGAGESVVQGLTKPDRFEVDKETLSLIQVEVSCKAKMIALGEKGVVEKDVKEDKQSLPCLEDHEVRMVAKLAKNSEAHYGVPLDIEWAVDSDLVFPENVFLVQARPITAIPKQTGSTEKILDLMITRLFKK